MALNLPTGMFIWDVRVINSILTRVNYYIAIRKKAFIIDLIEIMVNVWKPREGSILTSTFNFNWNILCSFSMTANLNSLRSVVRSESYCILLPE